MKKATYKQAGVDIAEGSVFKSKLQGLVRKTQGPQVLKGIGGFGSFFAFARNAYRDPVLVSSADGVGTKLKIALLADTHHTVGIDCVAMNVNDILCVGAPTLFFLDYIAYSRLSQATLLDIVRGLAEGCAQAGCALIGGETAQMPGMYAAGEYDLAGFCVGVIERTQAIDGSAVKAGDLVIGIESNGIHSNGYSLVRKVLSLKEQKRMSAELLRPTRIYVKPVGGLLKQFNGARDKAIRGIAHITGGAFYDKIARILPEGVAVSLDRSSWNVPQIFRLLQVKGGIEDREMYHTFNMGIGMVLIVDAQAAAAIVKSLAACKLRSWIIGKVIKGAKRVEII